MRDEATEVEVTGTWADASARELGAAARGWRTLRVEQMTDEARDVRSFVLKPVDPTAFADGAAGMHLVLRAKTRPDDAPLRLSYSLSKMPADGGYRISVKRAGPNLSAVRTHLQEGATVEARGPQGEFIAELASPRPVALLSNGTRAGSKLVVAPDIEGLDGQVCQVALPIDGKVVASLEPAKACAKGHSVTPAVDHVGIQVHD